MKRLAVCLILLLNVAFCGSAFGALGVFSTDNIVVGTSGASTYYTGATVFIIGGDSGTTAIVVQSKSGNTLYFMVKDGYVRQAQVWHAFGGYEDQGYTLNCDANVWTQIAKSGTSDLWSGMESDGVAMVDDEMVISNSGDYSGTVTITVSALNGKDFHIRVYNITQAKVEGYSLGISTTGAGNEMSVTVPVYIEATAGDILQLQMNSTDGTDPILDDALFYVVYLHD